MIKDKSTRVLAVYIFKIAKGSPYVNFLLRALPMELMGHEFSCAEVAWLVRRDMSSIRSARITGRLRYLKRNGIYRYSIYDILTAFETDSVHVKWTAAEKQELLEDGYCVTRSKAANKTMRWRMFCL